MTLDASYHKKLISLFQSGNPANIQLALNILEGQKDISYPILIYLAHFWQFEQKQKSDPEASRIVSFLRKRLDNEEYCRVLEGLEVFKLLDNTFVNQGLNYYHLGDQPSIGRNLLAFNKIKKEFQYLLAWVPYFLRRHYELAKVLWIEFEMEEATSLFEEVLNHCEAVSDYANAFFYLAKIAKEKKAQGEEALAFYQKFLELASPELPDNNYHLQPNYYPQMAYQPSAQEALSDMGDISIQYFDRADQAQEYYQQAIKLAPDSHQAPYQKIGNLLMSNQGSINQAISYFQKHAFNKQKSLIPELKSWYKREKNTRQEIQHKYFRIGDIFLYLLQQPDKAHIAYQQALSLDPQHFSDIIDKIKHLFQHLNAPFKVRAFCLRFMQAKNRDSLVEVLLDIGDYLSEEDHNKALSWYKLALRLAPNNPRLLGRQIHLIWKHYRDYWQIRALCKKMLQVDKNHPVALYYLKKIKKELGQ